jgi:membrane protease YdiL (CAAX protease family)
LIASWDAMRARVWLEEMLHAGSHATPAERLIPLPERASTPAAAIILAAVALFSLTSLLPTGFFHVPLWVVGMWSLLTLGAAVTASPAALHVAVFCTLVALAYRTSGLAMHPFPLVGALAGYSVVVLATPRLRETVRWLHTGSLEAGVRRLVLVSAALPAIALPAWYLLARPKIAQVVEGVADLPPWILPPVAVFFALVNAGAEEAAFRGILMDALEGAVGVAGALTIQAAAFGLIHYAHGIPNGLGGAILSSVYGLILGTVRLRARGIVAPWIAHAATDLVIFALLVGLSGSSFS